MSDVVFVKCRSCGAKNRVELKKIDSRPKCGRCGEHLQIPQGAIEIDGRDFYTEILEEPIPTVVDFWAPWCGPCRVVSPILDEIARTHRGKIKVVKINTDRNPDIAAQYGIQGIPTIILFKDGREVNRLVGAAPREEIERFLGLI